MYVKAVLIDDRSDIPVHSTFCHVMKWLDIFHLLHLFVAIKGRGCYQLRADGGSIIHLTNKYILDSY